MLDLEAALNQVGRSDTAVDEAIAIVRKANAEDSSKYPRSRIVIYISWF